MKSALADSARKDLIDAARRMSPSQRLRAFAEHSRWVVAMAAAGRRERASDKKASPAK